MRPARSQNMSERATRPHTTENRERREAEVRKAHAQADTPIAPQATPTQATAAEHHWASLRVGAIGVRQPDDHFHVPSTYSRG